jgi:hypothetical protein
VCTAIEVQAKGRGKDLEKVLMYEYKTAFFPRPPTANGRYWDDQQEGGWKQIFAEVTMDGAFVVFRRVHFGGFANEE